MRPDGRSGHSTCRVPCLEVSENRRSLNSQPRQTWPLSRRKDPRCAGCRSTLPSISVYTGESRAVSERRVRESASVGRTGPWGLGLSSHIDVSIRPSPPHNQSAAPGLYYPRPCPSSCNLFPLSFLILFLSQSTKPRSDTPYIFVSFHSHISPSHISSLLHLSKCPTFLQSPSSSRRTRVSSAAT